MRSFPLALVLLPVCSTALAQGAGGNPFSQSAFNPEISVIADFSFASVSIPDAAAEKAMLWASSNRDGKRRGFNFNFVELVLKAPVDPYFDLVAVGAFESDEAGFEEAYADTRALPWGFGLRLGKFFSSFGRFNALHRHAWGLLDAPLVYEAFTGGEGIKDIGFRLSWVAPVDFLLQLNFEVFQGKLEGNPTFNAGGLEMVGRDGTVVSVPEEPVPALVAGSIETSSDWGDHVILAGVSAMTGPTTRLALEGEKDEQVQVADRTWMYGVDLTYKYLIGPYSTLSLQTEFIRRRIDGNTILANGGRVFRDSFTQNGLYVEPAFRFGANGRWSAGARYDLMFEDETVTESPNGFRQRYSAKLDWNPTEFSRIRVQYAYDRSRWVEAKLTGVQEILLQLTFSVGPHGAHTF
jgi:hypothetical protein